MKTRTGNGGLNLSSAKTVGLTTSYGQIAKAIRSFMYWLIGWFGPAKPETTNATTDENETNMDDADRFGCPGKWLMGTCLVPR